MDWSGHYYRCFHLSGDVFLKVSKVRVQLLTERSHLELAENLIRKGAFSVFWKRLATMNNKYQEGFNETKGRTYGLLVDANDLYGGIMHKFPLPLSHFEILNVELGTILKTENDRKIGFVIEVDLDYPDALHNIHTDITVAPTKEKIDRNMLSEHRIKQAIDVLTRQSLYRRYTRRKNKPLLTITYSSRWISISKLLKYIGSFSSNMKSVWSPTSTGTPECELNQRTISKHHFINWWTTLTTAKLLKANQTGLT